MTKIYLIFKKTYVIVLITYEKLYGVPFSGANDDFDSLRNCKQSYENLYLSLNLLDLGLPLFFNLSNCN